MAVLVLIVLPLALICLAVPIYVSLLAAAAIGIVVLGIGSMEPVHLALFGGLDSYPLLAVPLFIFAGEVMGRGLSNSQAWALVDRLDQDSVKMENTRRRIAVAFGEM